MKECVVILGMHRSGTSVLTGLVSLFGGYVGSDLMKATEDNPKGYYENNKIYLLNERILRENKVSWDDYSFVSADIGRDKYQQYVSTAKEIIQDDFKYVKKTIIKDPRICILFPIWEQALKEMGVKIKLVFVYRSPMEVAHSLQKRDQIPVEKGLMIWSHYFFQSELYSRQYNCLLIVYDQDFNEMSVLLDRISTFVDLKVTNKIIRKADEFYTPSLKHHQVELDNISEDLPSYLKELIKLLASHQLDKKRKIDDLREEFEYSKQFYLYEHRGLVENHDKLLERFNQLVRRHDQLIESRDQLAESHTKLKNNLTKLDKKVLKLKIKHKEINEERIKDKNEFKEVITNLKKDISEKELIIGAKDKDLLRLESYLMNGDALSHDLLKSRVFYHRLRRSIKGIASLKVKNALLPFSSKINKRLRRDQGIIIKSGLFSAFSYLALNPDVKQAGMDPIVHFCKSGWKEGRSPSLYFDSKAYLRNNPDVVRANVNPLVHYILHGKREGRLVSPLKFRGKGQVVSKSTKNNKSNEKIVGPIIRDRWEASISIIKKLEQKHQLSDNTVPNSVIKLSQKSVDESLLKVSVIMPTWNRKDSIGAAVDSVLTQSYQSFELIIVDDGSSDDTLEMLSQRYESEITNGTIKVVKSNHEGVCNARNIGLSLSTGDLVAYLDSDNHWRKHYLLIMVSVFSENDELNCAYSALVSHDKNNSRKSIRATKYNRKQLIESNFIDLNVFVHRKGVYDQLGGFDVKLKRLVDWELIIRYTKNYAPAFVPFIGVDYYLDDKNLKNITTTVSLDNNREYIHRKHFLERLRYGLEDIRIAYVLWDFPALSQTFVMEELKWLLRQGYDLKVYYSISPDKAANLDFEVDAYLVKDSDELAELLKKHHRNLCHTHFAYPTTTLLTYPACVKTNTYFTFMPHAVDIFHHENKKRNKIGEISLHPLCLKVLVHGEFHKQFIEKCGVPGEKIAFNIQAVNVADFNKYTYRSNQNKEGSDTVKGIVISRFVEKKGLNTLIEAAAKLKNENLVFNIYGYGPLEKDYERQINAMDVDNVFLKGVLTDQQAVAKAYEESDFLIAPCVVAENGDMDGFPTVILEAMAVGLPVITTDVAAIPDYLTDGVEALVATAGDIQQIVDRIRSVIAMSPERKKAMVRRSQNFLDAKIGVDRTMQMLLDTWQSYTLDIFLVTFNTEKYDDKEETFEIISRIFKYTTTPFTLTIIDNNSDDLFWQELCKIVKGYANVRLIRKNKNQYCGPASNIALELSDSEFAIYICSKEGFIKKHGWERSLLDHMRSNPNNAMAGHYSQIPNYIYGREYEKYPEFSKFRNPDFAQKNPERIFKHVQGGVYIINRKFIKKHGGFNSRIPHGGMDIEMSYYMESLGYGLGEIPEVASLTVKTRPELPAILSERTVIAHPLTIKSVSRDLDSLVKENGCRCNICNWKGGLFQIDGEKQVQLCPSCSSTGFGRSIYRLLANNHHIYRKETCFILSEDKSLDSSLGVFFTKLFFTGNESFFLSKLNQSNKTIDSIIIDPQLIADQNLLKVWEMAVHKLSSSGELVFADCNFQDDRVVEDASVSANSIIRTVFSTREMKYVIKYNDFTSYCVAYDWRRFGVISRI